MSTLHAWDSKYKASDKAKGVDASYGITDKATAGWKGLSSYFEKALGTPTGQKLAAFYTKGDKQVRDIHAEARRLADLKAGKSSSTDPIGSTAPGATGPTPVPGTDKTTCQCGGDTGTCPCEPGKCACTGCSKSTIQGDHTATGPADAVTASTGLPPVTEKPAAA